MTTTKGIKLFLLLLSTGALFAVSSCKKDAETVATVLILDNSGKPVPGATVRLFGEPSENCSTCTVRFDTLQVTNGTGKVTFNFSDFYKSGQAGFAVLNIEATKGTLFGEGIIKIEEKKSNEESVTVE